MLDEIDRLNADRGVRARHAHASSRCPPAPMRATRTRPAARAARACSTCAISTLAAVGRHRESSSSRSRSRRCIENGTVVLNQSQLLVARHAVIALSDDPNVNGAADPDVAGDEDPTRVTIASAPVFRVQKISTDLTGDPNVLLAGETLRYTITVQEHRQRRRDRTSCCATPCPANTTYVAGSTTLNGAAVADAGGHVAARERHADQRAGGSDAGLDARRRVERRRPTSPRSRSTSSSTRASSTARSSRTRASSARVDSGIVDHPSDDPDTPIAERSDARHRRQPAAALTPTKRVALSGRPAVRRASSIRATCCATRSPSRTRPRSPATGVVLRDAVPANTTYVANSTLLNGLPVGQPDGGVVAARRGHRHQLVRSDAAAAGRGRRARSRRASPRSLQFDLRVNAGMPAGTLISNQAVRRQRSSCRTC